MGYFARLRFRSAREFKSDEINQTCVFAGRSIAIEQEIVAGPLARTVWITVTARNFSTEEEAISFGQQLKASLAAASVRSGIGIDVGNNRASISYSRKHLDDIFQRNGYEKRPQVHGLHVYPDDRDIRFETFEMQLAIAESPGHFLRAVEEELEAERTEPNPAPLRLLNAALMAREPLSQLVLAVAAVEFLAHSYVKRKWSPDQKQLRENLSEIAIQADNLSPEEAGEVASAIARSFPRGINEACNLLIARLGLEESEKRWKDLYGKRSKIFHGGVAMSHEDYSTLAMEAVRLATTIVLADRSDTGSRSTLPSSADKKV